MDGDKVRFKDKRVALALIHNLGTTGRGVAGSSCQSRSAGQGGVVDGARETTADIETQKCCLGARART